MDLFDFFFPEQAQASHLRKIASQRSVSARPIRGGGGAQSAELQALREDVGFLSLVTMALLKRLTETESLSLADLQDLLDEIDALDGVADGRLDPGVLRGLLGVLKSGSEEQSETENEEFKVITTPRYRRR